QAALVQRLRRDLVTLDAAEVADIHDLEERAEVLVVEAALRHAPLQRHLAALEPRRDAVMPGARLLPLVSLAGRLALARARAAPQPLAAAVRTLGTTEIAQIRHDSSPATSSTRTRCWTWFTMPRIAALSSCTTVAWCFSPSAASVLRCSPGRPMPLRTCVMRR